MNKHDKPRVISVYPPHTVQPERTTSIEDEAPTIPLSMATPAAETVNILPRTIILRPSWLDLPAQRLLGRLTLLGICAIPAAIIITTTIHVTWRLL